MLPSPAKPWFVLTKNRLTTTADWPQSRCCLPCFFPLKLSAREDGMAVNPVNAFKEVIENVSKFILDNACMTEVAKTKQT